MVRIHFNGVDLTRWVTVTSGFSALDGADFEPQFHDYVVGGSDFLYTRKKSKRIPVPFYVRYETVDTYDEFQKALNVKEPKELTFSIFPNRVFYAIPTGSLNFKEIKLSGKGTIDFIIADGLGHSTIERNFTFSKNAQGIFEARIINNGSEEIHVDYEVKLKKESGFLGIVSQYGATQFGKAEEVDGVIAEKSVLLASNKAGNFSNWTDGTIFYENQGKKSVTNMSSDGNEGGRLGLLPSQFTNSANGAQFGAVKELTLSESAQNWYIWAKARFETGLMGQTGSWCLAVVDERNRFIAGMAIEKTDTVGNTAQIHFLLGDGNGGSHAKKTIPFTPNSELGNPYGSEARKKNRNMFDIRKEGDKVTFYWYGSYFHFYESGIRNVTAKKVQFFVGQYRGRNTSNQLVTVRYLNDFTFTKIKVPYWKDIPNRYPAGTDLRVVGEEGRLYVNNQPALNDEILGSQYVRVPPGETKVQLLVSGFSEIESATATIKEKFI